MVARFRFPLCFKNHGASVYIDRALGVYTCLVVACLLLKFYFLFMPIATGLVYDETEHLHVAYLMSLGDRPYVDFIENHPMLFNHYLGWVKNIFHIETTRAWAQVARWTLFLHFLLFIAVAGIWMSKLMGVHGSTKIRWAALFATALVMVDFSNAWFSMVWQIRPDFICHAYTLLGCYMAYLAFRSGGESISKRNIAGLIIGGFAVGIGNAILPKGAIILISILLTVITAEFLSPAPFARRNFSWRKGTLFIAVFTGSVFVSFCAGMLIDCHLSNILPGKWISAVILINAEKHIVFCNADANPVMWMLNAFSAGSLPVALLMILLIIAEAARLKTRIVEARGEVLLFLNACYMILVNMLIPPYSNGATWAHHFIPAIFSVTVFFLILTLRVVRTAFKPYPTYALGLTVIGVAAFFIYLSLQLVDLPHKLYDTIQSRKVSARDLGLFPQGDFIADAYRQKGFTYFADFPDRLPVQSRQWGFYYMLGADSKFWEHCHKLGIGPDPTTMFKNGFGQSPPDAVIFATPEDVIEYVVIVRRCHNIDARQIVNDIRIRYTPMKTERFWMYVRNDHVDMLSRQGWQTAPEYALVCNYDVAPAMLQVQERN